MSKMFSELVRDQDGYPEMNSPLILVESLMML